MENQMPPIPSTPQTASSVTYVQLPPQKNRRSLFAGFLSGLGCLVVLFSLIMNFGMMIALSGTEIAELNKTVLQEGSDEQVVAVYSVDGVIDGRAAAEFARFFRNVKKSDKIRGVVIRVDSPGGGIAASDEIYKMITDLKSSGKKVVVSMGGVAASGGYYISAPADYIFAEPTTITGSIGVIMQLFNLENTMYKLGVSPVTITSSNAALWKDQGSPFRPMSERERANFVTMLDSMQKRFETVVSTSRPKIKKQKETYTEKVTVGDDTADVEIFGGKKTAKDKVTDGVKTKEITKTDFSPFNGQIYGTQQAIAIGLVDEQGYLADAWAKAASLAELNNAKVVHFAKRSGFFFEIAEGISNFRKVSTQAAEPRFLMQWGVN